MAEERRSLLPGEGLEVVDNPTLQQLTLAVRRDTVAFLDDLLGTPSPELTAALEAGLGLFLAMMFGRTPAEVAAAATPTAFGYQPGDPRRFGAVFDNATDSQAALATALSVSGETRLPNGVVRVGTGNLSKALWSVARGAGRELTFVRTTHATNPVFASVNSFVTYEHMTVDRSGSVAGTGIQHLGVNNNSPLEGFKLRQCNINGHATGVVVKDFVILSIEDCYIQSCAEGVNATTTGSNANTMLHMARCWVRGNSSKCMSLTSVINVVLDQVAFESSATGLSLSACNEVVLTNCWFEALAFGGDFTACPSVSFNSGQFDGTALTARAFYFNGLTGASIVIFDGAWRTAGMSGKIFATADTAATIYVRSPSLASLTWEAVNGGKVIFDFDMVGAATYNPPSLAANATATTSVTVAGAAVGDLVEVFFENGTTDPRQLLLSGNVTAADTVGVLLRNMSGGTLDAASGTLTVKVRKKPLLS